MLIRKTDFVKFLNTLRSKSNRNKNIIYWKRKLAKIAMAQVRTWLLAITQRDIYPLAIPFASDSSE